MQLPFGPTLKAMVSDRRGQAIVIFGLILPVLIVCLTGSVDYAHWLSNRSEMQNAADTAALAGAKELRLADVNPTAVMNVARRSALAELGAQASDATVTARIINQTGVQIDIDSKSPSMFGSLAPAAFSHIHVTSLAQTASSPACLIALNPTGQGIMLDTAVILANGCATYSNSQNSNGLQISAGSLTSAQTCSAGGVKLTLGVILPPAITDCPIISDPLASRSPPSVGGCDFNNKVVSQGSETLSPGTYCGGLTVTNNAIVSLNAGVYIIKDGPLSVNENATLQGDDVGFFLTGQAALLDLDLLSNVSLMAPKDGPLAGILIFEDPQSQLGRQHIFASRSAPRLIGTIYLPRGNLSIGEKLIDSLEGQLSLNIASCLKLSLTYPCSPPQINIGSLSSWTIIIANQVTVNVAVNLVLNTNYAGSTTGPPSELSLSGAMLTK